MPSPPRLDRRSFLAALGTAAIAGCIGDDTSPQPEAWISYEAFDSPTVDLDMPADRPTDDVTVEPIVTGLEIPWDLDFDTEGNLYLTERTGRVYRLANDDLEEIVRPEDAIDAETATDGWWVEGGEGGTLGVAVSPDDTHLFVYYTANGSDRVNRVARYELDASDPADSATIVIDDIPAANVHNGGRLAFGPDGYLWVTTGDADDPDRARDPDSLAGKVLRVDVDGEAPPDNPDHDGDPRIVTAGHRNVQGIDWLTDDVAIITEHGPHMRDELSLVYPGGDYGWDDVRGGPDDDAGEENEYGRYADHPFVVPPLVHLEDTTWAPSGLTWYTGESVPSWHHRLLVAGLTSQRLFVLTLTPPGGDLPSGGRTYDVAYLDDAFTVTAHQALANELGRVRHVAQTPDGELYAISSNLDGRASGGFPRDDDDRLVRIVAG